MSGLRECLLDLSAGLQAAGVRWFVFGAQAVAVRGAPRATQDLDVTVVEDDVDVRAVVAALHTVGFRHRYPELADELLTAGAVLPLVHRDGFDVDVVIGRSGLERMAMKRASIENLADVPVPVASSTDLLVMKLLAGRGKDIDDARSLLASGTVDETLARDLLGQLDAALDRGDLVPTLKALTR